MKDNPKYIRMMKGDFGNFTQQELWQILLHQNELGINTLKVQRMIDGAFICRVDNLSVNRYLLEDNLCLK
jgi:hypothetical protein